MDSVHDIFQNTNDLSIDQLREAVGLPPRKISNKKAGMRICSIFVVACVLLWVADSVVNVVRERGDVHQIFVVNQGITLPPSDSDKSSRIDIMKATVYRLSTIRGYADDYYLGFLRDPTYALGRGGAAGHNWSAEIDALIEYTDEMITLPGTVNDKTWDTWKGKINKFRSGLHVFFPF